MRSRNRIALLGIVFLCTLPISAFAASPSMRQASQSLLSKGIAASDHKLARRYLEQSIVADPANAAALGALGNLYSRQGKKDEARKYFDLALEVDPVEPTALSGAAALDIADGKTADARDKLRKLKIVCPACTQTNELESKLGAGTPAAPVPHP